MITLPIPDQDREREIKLAQAYYDWLHRDRLGDQEEVNPVEMLAHYQHMRRNRMDLLEDLAGEKKQQGTGITVGMAYTHFFSKICHGCGRAKPASYWVCNDCWRKLPREGIKDSLFRGWRQEDVPVYGKALEHLAGLREQAVAK